MKLENHPTGRVYKSFANKPIFGDIAGREEDDFLPNRCWIRNILPELQLPTGIYCSLLRQMLFAGIRAA